MNINKLLIATLITASTVDITQLHGAQTNTLRQRDKESANPSTRVTLLEKNARPMTQTMQIIPTKNCEKEDNYENWLTQYENWLIQRKTKNLEIPHSKLAAWFKMHEAQSEITRKKWGKGECSCTKQECASYLQTLTFIPCCWLFGLLYYTCFPKEMPFDNLEDYLEVVCCEWCQDPRYRT